MALNLHRRDVAVKGSVNTERARTEPGNLRGRIEGETTLC
jgi:hypothetical protein